MATKLPYVLPFEDGSVVAAILLKAQGLPETEQIATKTDLQQATAYLATLDNATMAPQSAAVKRETDNLQAQINNIVRAPESGGDVGAEVYQARIDADGVSHTTLKARLDSDFLFLTSNIQAFGISDNILCEYLESKGINTAGQVYNNESFNVYIASVVPGKTIIAVSNALGMLFTMKSLLSILSVLILRDTRLQLANQNFLFRFLQDTSAFRSERLQQKFRRFIIKVACRSR
jgi:hypothetical protein